MNINIAGKALIFGGCYSNLQAAEALLEQAGRLGIPPANMICTGDIIAYGADAKATLRLLRNAGIRSVMGNCEEALAAGAGDCGCGFAPGSACDTLATEWYAHAAAQMDADDRRYMADLPREIRLQMGDRKILVVHGNVERNNAFVFGSASELELSRQFTLAGCDAVLAGHCGMPFTRRVAANIWHNAGSIGMPANDGTPRGWFSVIEAAGNDLIIAAHPLNYDYAGAARAMRAAGLPEGYAAALETGIWPSLDILPGWERLHTGKAVEAAAPAAPAPMVGLASLRTLWVNTGTLCNIACVGCFMESSPRNDALSYFSLAAFQQVLAQAPASLAEIGFTGGEPFMNPDLLAMLEASLRAGKRVLVLTNAMRPMAKAEQQLAELLRLYPGHIAVRVSLDHHQATRHEELRGPGSFATSLAGLQYLSAAGAEISVASRTPWGESETMMRAGFAALFAASQIRLDAYDPARLILFPEMDTGSPAAPVTAAALAALPAGHEPMCASARMVVQRKGEPGVSFTPCTLLPKRDMGRDLAGARAPVALDHPFCGQFCVFGGAACS